MMVDCGDGDPDEAHRVKTRAPPRPSGSIPYRARRLRLASLAVLGEQEGGSVARSAPEFCRFVVFEKSGLRRR